MKGTYYVDEDKVRSFYRQGLISHSIMIGVVWLFFMILIFVGGATKDQPFLFAGIITVICLVMIAKWMAETGNRTFERTQIIIEKGYIMRVGEGLSTVRIEFKGMGRIHSQRNGFFILRKGFLRFFAFYTSKYQQRYYLFVPSMIENYDEIKAFIKSVK